MPLQEISGGGASGQEAALSVVTAPVGNAVTVVKGIPSTGAHDGASSGVPIVVTGTTVAESDEGPPPAYGSLVAQESQA